MEIMTLRQTIRNFRTDDIQQAQVLVELDKWQQVPGDWERMIDAQSEGCFAAEPADRLVGTRHGCQFSEKLCVDRHLSMIYAILGQEAG
jgi:hypothetical protein